jgi:hypothetical protein
MLQQLSRMCGYFMSNNICIPQETTVSTIARLIRGMELITDSWLLLDQLPSLSLPLLSVAASHLQNLFNRSLHMLDPTGGGGAGSSLLGAVGPVVLVTSNSTFKVRSELPQSLNVMLRPVCLSLPNELHIMQVLPACCIFVKFTANMVLQIFVSHTELFNVSKRGING